MTLTLLVLKRETSNRHLDTRFVGAAAPPVT
jgi:hypothetical protein